MHDHDPGHATGTAAHMRLEALMNRPALLPPPADHADNPSPNDDEFVPIDDLATALSPAQGVASSLPDAPIGGKPTAVATWFDAAAAAAKVNNDGSLAAVHDSARAYRSRAKADNTRAAYRSAVRAWCVWCT